MSVNDVYSALQTAIRALDQVATWSAFVDDQLAAAGKTGRMLTAQERAAVATIRARWVAYRERVEALMAASMPDPDGEA